MSERLNSLKDINFKTGLKTAAKVGAATSFALAMSGVIEAQDSPENSSNNEIGITQVADASLVVPIVPTETVPDLLNTIDVERIGVYGEEGKTLADVQANIEIIEKKFEQIIEAGIPKETFDPNNLELLFASDRGYIFRQTNQVGVNEAGTLITLAAVPNEEGGADILPMLFGPGQLNTLINQAGYDAGENPQFRESKEEGYLTFGDKAMFNWYQTTIDAYDTSRVVGENILAKNTVIITDGEVTSETTIDNLELTGEDEAGFKLARMKESETFDPSDYTLTKLPNEPGSWMPKYTLTDPNGVESNVKMLSEIKGNFDASNGPIIEIIKFPELGIYDLNNNIPGNAGYIVNGIYIDSKEVILDGRIGEQIIEIPALQFRFLVPTENGDTAIVIFNRARIGENTNPSLLLFSGSATDSGKFVLADELREVMQPGMNIAAYTVNAPNRSDLANDTVRSYFDIFLDGDDRLKQIANGSTLEMNYEEVNVAGVAFISKTLISQTA